MVKAMTNIVERLRQYARTVSFDDPPEDYLVWQAANEIERLVGIIAKRNDENGRLRAESNISDGLLADAKAKIKRLTAALTYISEHGDMPADQLAMTALRALEPKP